MEENNLSKHEQKEQKKSEKDESKEHSLKQHNKKKLTKKIIGWSIFILVVLGILFLFYRAINISKNFQPYHTGFYHWHANFDVSICGVSENIRCGASICGPMSLHHHNDNIIHIEGNTIPKKEDLAIGRFFDGIDIKFSETEILDKKNGDLCPDGKAGSVKLYVNGELNNEFGNYSPAKCEAQDISDIREQCDKIEIKFE